MVGVQVTNAQATPAFVQVFDAPAANATAVRLGTMTPTSEYLIAGNTTQSITLPAVGQNYANGIVVASTTGENGTTGSAAGVMIYVQSVP